MCIFGRLGVFIIKGGFYGFFYGRLVLLRSLVLVGVVGYRWVWFLGVSMGGIVKVLGSLFSFFSSEIFFFFMSGYVGVFFFSLITRAFLRWFRGGIKVLGYLFISFVVY